jgi:RNA polymerase sigma factor (sigma-70 family)
MVSVLGIIASQHQKWINIVRSFGMFNYPEDIVQNMYLKIHKWNGKYDASIMYNETEINEYFIFKVLRNLFLDYHKTKKVKIDSTFYEPSISDISKYISKYEYKERLGIVQDEIKTWHLYDQKIYELIFLENKSMLELSKQTGIDYYSIYRSVKKIKKILISKL